MRVMQASHIMTEDEIREALVRTCIILDSSNIDYHDDGSVSLIGDCNVRHYTRELPIKFRHVSGDFFCNHSVLTSLKNCPDTIGGSFYCCNSKITSLEGAPQIVHNFDCTRTAITTLAGAPEIVNGYFNCSDSYLLTSLVGGPKKVRRNFDCSRTKLTSLQGLPEEIDGDLDIMYRKFLGLLPLIRFTSRQTYIAGAPTPVVNLVSKYQGTGIKRMMLLATSARRRYNISIW